MCTYVVIDWEKKNKGYKFPSWKSHFSLMIEVKKQVLDILWKYYKGELKGRKSFTDTIRFFVKEKEIEVLSIDRTYQEAGD